MCVCVCVCVCDDKTEAMIVSSGRKSIALSFSFPDFITVGCASVPLSDSVKNLGVTLAAI